MSDLSKHDNPEVIGDDEFMNFNLIRKQVEQQIGDITFFEKIPKGSNEIFFIRTGERKLIVKIYNEKKSQRTNLSREIQMTELLKNLPEIRKMLFSNVTRSNSPHEFAVFDYIEGQSLRSLVESGLLSEEQLEDISGQIFDLINKISRTTTVGFGQVDESGIKGMSETWPDFLETMQDPTIKTFEDSGTLPPSVYLAPRRILAKYKDKFMLDSPKLIPMDLNIDNIIITPDSKIKFIDPETFWSGDPLCAYAQFYALTRGTPLGEKFIGKLSLSEDNEFRVRFYALLDNLNVLGYITRIDPGATMNAKPWGNPNKFIDLINDHIDYFNKYEI